MTDPLDPAAVRARSLLDSRDRFADVVGYADRELAESLRAVLDVVGERDAEIARLRAGGCARAQGLTQYCAEAASLAAELRKWQTPRSDDALDAVREQWERGRSLATAQAYINGLLHANAHLGTERASTVAWLRQNAERVGQALAAHPNAGSVSRRNRSTRIHAYRELADAIERGEHAKEEG